MAQNEDGFDFEAMVNDKLGVIQDDTSTATTDDSATNSTDDSTSGVATDDTSTANATGDDNTGDAATVTDATTTDDATTTTTDDATTDDAATTTEDDTTPSNLSVDDIKKVLDERDAQAAFDVQRYKEITTEVTSDLYPNGFDIALKDEQGHVIANVEDYKQYIDPNATTEDAQRIIMNEQSRLNKEVQQAREFIAEKAELKNTMENEAVKVFTKYKDYFLKNPEIQVKIANNYRKTLKLLNNTIVEAPLGLEDFYDFAMKPYIDSLPATPAATATATTTAPVTTVQQPKETISDDRLDLVGSATGEDGLVVDGKPNWKKIVDNKLKGK